MVGRQWRFYKGRFAIHVDEFWKVWMPNPSIILSERGMVVIET